MSIYYKPSPAHGPEYVAKIDEVLHSRRMVDNQYRNTHTCSLTLGSLKRN